MFLDAEYGMGIWTRHVTDDGRVFYYNMKRNMSKWEYEFMDASNTTTTNESAMNNTVRMQFWY